MPEPGQPLYKLMGKLIHFRMGIQLDEDIRNFDPAEYVKSLTATGVKKLQKGVIDLLKDVQSRQPFPSG